MKTLFISLTTCLTVLVGGSRGVAQDGQPSAGSEFSAASDRLQQRLEESLQELARRRSEIATAKVPLAAELRQAEADLSNQKLVYQDKSRSLQQLTLRLSRLQGDIKARKATVTYLEGLLAQFITNMEAGLPIAELPRHQDALKSAREAPSDPDLSKDEVFTEQAAILGRAIDRLDEVIGGMVFDGAAVDQAGLVSQGKFAAVGPSTLFRSSDGKIVGVVEQQLSLQPMVLELPNPEMAESAASIVQNLSGSFPLDPTDGDALKIASTEETMLEHVQKGGAIIYPIFAMALAALIVALWRWLSLTTLSKPSGKQMGRLLESVADHDVEAAEGNALRIKGPIGQMLSAGVKHIREPRELIEEVMYERVMRARLQINAYLPFIAICAASAPLLGLLGTVTGIIGTFKQITIYGSSDVKLLSAGISEALITTKFGLIVAIPSLMIHAYLSRKARSYISEMEGSAVAFVNEVGKSPIGRYEARSVVDPETVPASGQVQEQAVRTQVKEILGELLGPLASADDGDATMAVVVEDERVPS